MANSITPPPPPTSMTWIDWRIESAKSKQTDDSWRDSFHFIVTIPHPPIVVQTLKIKIKKRSCFVCDCRHLVGRLTAHVTSRLFFVPSHETFSLVSGKTGGRFDPPKKEEEASHFVLLLKKSQWRPFIVWPGPLGSPWVIKGTHTNTGGSRPWASENSFRV
jgi:hypothetical protein